MLAGSGARNQEDIRREVEQPRQRDLRWRGTQAETQVNEERVREDCVLTSARRSQRKEGHERNPSSCAFVQDGKRRLVGDVEQVLHADDLRLFNGNTQMIYRDVAEADAVDQPLV